MSRILIADDEALRLLSSRLSNKGYEVVGIGSSAGVWPEDLRQFDVVLVDGSPPDRRGFELMARVREADEDLPVIVLTRCGSVRDAVDAVRSGAADYVVKPLDVGVMAEAISKLAAGRGKRAGDDGVVAGAVLDGSVAFLGSSPKVKHVRLLIERVASTRSTILVFGESGTGKEVVAQSIHVRSHSGPKPFVKVNCAGIPASLFESELFGHVRGSFTGAHESRKGKFEIASGGSILLDEISEVPLALQPKLLRVLEERRFSQIGTTAESMVSARVIAATNRDLARMVAQGAFRRDLFYRLNVFPIRLPALREHKEDIPAISVHLLQSIIQGAGVETRGLSEECMCALLSYEWPGNVRELRNVLERAVVLVGDGVIEVEHLPWELRRCATKFENTKDFRSRVDAFKRLVLVDALRSTGWRKGAAAERLGLSQRAFSHYVVRFALDEDRGVE